MSILMIISGIMLATLSTMYKARANPLILYLAFLLFFLILAFSYIVLRRVSRRYDLVLSRAAILDVYMRFHPHGHTKLKMCINISGACITAFMAYNDMTPGPGPTKWIVLLWLGLTLFIWRSYGKQALEYQLLPLILFSAAFSCIEFAWTGITGSMPYSMNTTMLFGWSVAAVRRRMFQPVVQECVYAKFD